MVKKLRLDSVIFLIFLGPTPPPRMATYPRKTKGKPRPKGDRNMPRLTAGFQGGQKGAAIMGHLFSVGHHLNIWTPDYTPTLPQPW